MSEIYTDADKLKEIEREVMQRHRVYPRMIAAGKLKKETAQRQMQLLDAVRRDYVEKIRTGPLFTEPPRYMVGAGMISDGSVMELRSDGKVYAAEAWAGSHLIGIMDGSAVKGQQIELVDPRGRWKVKR